MIAEMAKIQLAAPLPLRDPLLAWLQDEEILHISQEVQVAADAPPSHTGYELAQLQFTLEFISRLRHELKAIPKKNWKNLFASKPVASLFDLNKTLKELPVQETITMAHGANQELTDIIHEQEVLHQELKQYEPWQQLRLHHQAATKATQHLVTFTSRHELPFLTTLAELPTAVWQEIHRVAKGKIEVIFMEIVVHTDDTPSLTALLSDHNIETVTLSLDTDETIAGHINQLRSKQTQLQQKYQGLLTHATPLLSLEEKVKFAYDAILHTVEREQVSSKVRNLPHTFLMIGWIPKKLLPSFNHELEQKFPTAALQEIDPLASDKPPVAFVNPAVIQPFEAVTNLYGKPGYHELDPSGPLSLFFLLAFGLALTDAGYGIILMVVTLAAEKFFRLKKDMKKMTRLLFLGGAMTVILGALTGGWFGITLETLPDGTIKNILLGMKILDPLTEPMQLLGWAFAIGVAQLLFAWVVKGVYMWRMNNRLQAILDNGPWLLIVVAIMAWVATQAGVLPASSSQLAKWIVWVALAIVIITQGRSYKNPFLKLGGGILSLFGLMSFISDTLSYSRLLALGLATGIIGFVVNLLAGMAMDQIPFIGLFVAIGILLIGHTFNLAINALGAFIHAGRLQFVEFFPKFLEGGGLPYKPLGRVGRYVDNPKEFT